MSPEVIINIAKSASDLEKILEIQKSNHIKNLPESEKEAEGFVTVRHDPFILNKMNAAAPQIVARVEDKIVGYAMVMFKEFGNLIPVLLPMFQIFSSLTFNGKKLNDYNYYVMGQVCISKSYRGMGIFDRLYLKHKEIYSKQFDFCLTEVSVRNKRSMKAHENIGFKVIHTFQDEVDTRNILLWEWN